MTASLLLLAAVATLAGSGELVRPNPRAANIGLGLGLRSDRSTASRAATQFDSFCDHLRHLGLLSAPVDGRRLGGWLKMGMVGTVPARDRTFLVGDAAGLINPLQGEGIAAAVVSAALAAAAIIAGPGAAATNYRRLLADGPGRFAAATAPLHHAAIDGSPIRVAMLGRLLTLPVLRSAIAPTWSLAWNDLVDGANPGPTAVMSRLALAAGRVATRRSTISERLRHDRLATENQGSPFVNHPQR